MTVEASAFIRGARPGDPESLDKATGAAGETRFAFYKIDCSNAAAQKRVWLGRELVSRRADATDALPCRRTCRRQPGGQPQ